MSSKKACCTFFLLFLFNGLFSQSLLNDECSGAIQIPTNGSTYLDKHTNIGATLSRPGCGSEANNDIWFKFIATGTRHQIAAGIENSLDNNYAIIEVFSGSCGNLHSILCNTSPSGVADVIGLTPGTTYYYRVYLSNGDPTRTDFTTYIKTIDPPPANDEPTGAIGLTAGRSLSAAINYATQTFPSCVDNNYQAMDVWFSFKATATSQDISLTPTSFNDYVLQAYSGTAEALTPITDCINLTGLNEKEGTTLNNLTIGQTYFVRVFERYEWARPTCTFDIQVSAHSGLKNDECSGAIQIPTNGSTYLDKHTNIGATLSRPGCGSEANNDIWFKFIATGTRHQIAAGIENSLDNNYAIIEVFSGSCGNLHSILCNTSPSGVADVIGLTPGTTYYYRVYLSNGDPTRTDFTTYIKTIDPPPANDEPTGAIGLTAGRSLSAAINYATQTFPSCVDNNYQAMDVWFSFKATATSQDISLTPTSFNDYVLQAYSGTAEALTPITDCINLTGLNEKEGTTLNNLTIGQTYFVRVFERYEWARPTCTFDIQVSAHSGLKNDECSGAIQIPTNGSTYLDKHTNIGATLSRPGCGSEANNDIWFKFIATGTRHQIAAGIENSLDNNYAIIEVFSGSCGNLHSILCNTSPSGVADVIGLTPGTTYYYRVYLSNGDPTRTDFTTYIKTIDPPPANDEPTGAIELTAGRSLSAAINYATQTFPSCVDNNYQAMDVWFSFKATATSQDISLTPTSFNDYVLQAYSGTAEALTPITDCINLTGLNEKEGTTLNNLTIGQTYFVRVFERYEWARPTCTFDIQVSQTLTTPITLSHLGVSVVKSEDILAWITASESNIQSFDVEFSTDGLNFRKIKNIATKSHNGNSSYTINYDFKRSWREDSLSIAYYRLKIIEQDRHFTYTPVISVVHPSLSNVRIFPNPTFGKITIENASDNIIIYKSDGQVVLQKQLKQRGNVILDISFLPENVYFIKVKNMTFKIIKR